MKCVPLFEFGILSGPPIPTTITKEVLKDWITIKSAYQAVIKKNNYLIKDKIIIDVGNGTGILSLFCAKAGAKHVYTIECSTSAADKVRNIVKVNGYSKVITVFGERIENIQLSHKADVIISDWMGHFLVYPNRLITVIYAHKHMLVEGGLILPNTASLFLAAIEDYKYNIEAWTGFDFDMSCVRKHFMSEPLIGQVDLDQLVTDCRPIKTMEVSKMDSKDTSFSVPFMLTAKQDGVIHAFMTYFDASFTGCKEHVYFSTGPQWQVTRWKQIRLCLENGISIRKGQCVGGNLEVHPNKENPNDVNIMITYSIFSQDCIEHHERKIKVNYRLSSDHWHGNDKAKLMSKETDYTESIKEYRHLIEEKVVLEIGRGTRMNSLVCAKVGAKHVYAIDCPRIVQDIATLNGYSNVITFLSGNVEANQFQVDVILSEWIGKILVHDKMLDNVCANWNVAKEFIFPSFCTLFIAATEDEDFVEDNIEYWNRIHGFDMSCIRKQYLSQPTFGNIHGHLATDFVSIKTFTSYRLPKEGYVHSFNLKAIKDEYIHAFVIFFDVSFAGEGYLTL